MSSKVLSTGRWAILIGVGLTIDNREPRNPRDRSLKGAVADVTAIKTFLEASLPDIDVKVLTASKSSDDSASSEPQESANQLATRKNITSALERVIKLGKYGDHVYLHFSGHGVRRDQDGAIALALYSKNASGTTYFMGHYLRDYLHMMQENGLLVTLVLDCCFSGSVLRHGNLHGVRSLDYDARIDMESEEENIADSHFFHQFRDASLTLDQLLKNESHVILTACGPDEYASEVTLEGGESRGALSFLLLGALTSLKMAGAKVTHRSLYQSLRAKFHVHQQLQTPLLFGLQKESFFIEIETSDYGIELVPVYRHKGSGSLILDAGQAHGVHEGDEYAAYPFETQESMAVLASHMSVRLRVQRAEALSSYLQAADQCPKSADVIRSDSSWKAQLITSFSAKKIWIRLAHDLPNHNFLLAQAENHHYLKLSTDEAEERPYIFQVRVTNDKPTAFVIETLHSTEVPNVPRVLVEEVDSENRLIRLMGHLATFKYFESLDNRSPDPEFENSFSLTCDLSLEADGYYNVADGKSLNFTFKNKDSNERKHITIFNFKANWGVENLGKGGWLSVLPNRTHPLHLTMKLPEPDSGLNERDDILRIFIASQSANFPAVLLQPIHRDVFRDDVNGPEQLLDSLRDVMRDKGSRWTTRTYFIRTGRN